MVDYNAPLFQHPQETWDAKKCEKLANRVAKDGRGTPYPFKGYLSESSQYGVIRYNGGCVRDDKWWQGEEHKLPIVAAGFEIVHLDLWGYRIQKLGTLPHGVETYRGVEMTENPLTGDWLIDLGNPFGVYCTDKSRIKKIINGYHKNKTPACTVSATPTQILESDDGHDNDDESGTKASQRMVRAAGSTVG